MRVAVAHGRVRAHHVVIVTPLVVPQVDALSAHQHHRQRRVVARAEPLLEHDGTRVGARGWRPHRRVEQIAHEARGAPVRVERGVVFGDLHRHGRAPAQRRAQPGQELRRAQAVRSRRAHAGRILRVERIEVDADAEARGRGADVRDRFVECGLQSAALDFLHEVYAHAQPLHERRLGGLEAADAEEAQRARIEPVFPGDGNELGIAVAQQTRERHAVPHPGAARLGGVRVHVRVDPQQPRSASRRHGARDTRPRPHGAGVIAAEHHGQRLRLHRGKRMRRHLSRHVDHLGSRIVALVRAHHARHVERHTPRPQRRDELSGAQRSRTVLAARIGCARATRYADHFDAPVGAQGTVVHGSSSGGHPCDARTIPMLDSRRGGSFAQRDSAETACALQFVQPCARWPKAARSSSRWRMPRGEYDARVPFAG